MKKDLAVIICPPYPEYKEYPKDQSHSELHDCPKCKNQMWLSDKKKGLLMFSSFLGKEILLACYDCITKIAKENPEFFTDSEEVEL
jgi:hypothetical protein